MDVVYRSVRIFVETVGGNGINIWQFMLDFLNILVPTSSVLIMGYWGYKNSLKVQELSYKKEKDHRRCDFHLKQMDELERIYVEYCESLKDAETELEGGKSKRGNELLNDISFKKSLIRFKLEYFQKRYNQLSDLTNEMINKIDLQTNLMYFQYNCGLLHALIQKSFNENVVLFPLKGLNLGIDDLGFTDFVQDDKVNKSIAKENLIEVKKTCDSYFDSQLKAKEGVATDYFYYLANLITQ